MSTDNNVGCCCKYFPFSYNALLLNVLVHLQCPGKVQDIASHYGTISLQMINFEDRMCLVSVSV